MALTWSPRHPLPTVVPEGPGWGLAPLPSPNSPPLPHLPPSPIQTRLAPAPLDTEPAEGGMVTALVSITDDPKPEALKQQDCILSQFWRPKVRNHGVAGLRSFWRLQGRSFLPLPVPGGPGVPPASALTQVLCKGLRLSSHEGAGCWT